MRNATMKVVGEYLTTLNAYAHPPAFSKTEFKK